jgi:clan AA aspartic protease (TIGR02281 family)
MNRSYESLAKNGISVYSVKGISTTRFYDEFVNDFCNIFLCYAPNLTQEGVMRTMTLVFLICFFHTAVAETYKCVQSGHTTYSSTPCDGNAQIINQRLSVSDGSERHSVSILRGSNGIYSLPGSVNGKSLTFAVDTGASATTICGDDAARLGIHSCVATGVASTANGLAAHCRITVSSLSFAGFNFFNVAVNVAPAMKGMNLIGNDLLSKFKIEQQGGVMILSK